MVCRATRDPSGEPCWGWNVEYPPVAEFGTKQEAEADAERRNLELREGRPMIDRELLRKAYPNGFLAMRGVQTVCGWTCLFADTNPYGGDHVAVGFHHTGEECRLTCWPDGRVLPCSSERHGHPLPLSNLERRLCEGDLLPDVDPEDVATWACCLADLAEALDLVNPSLPKYDFVTGHAWRSNAWEHDFHGDKFRWWIDVHTSAGHAWSHRFDELETTRDPALALVLARIQLREKEGR
jgi:hypothetical protein